MVWYHSSYNSTLYLQCFNFCPLLIYLIIMHIFSDCSFSPTRWSLLWAQLCPLLFLLKHLLHLLHPNVLPCLQLSLPPCIPSHHLRTATTWNQASMFTVHWRFQLLLRQSGTLKTSASSFKMNSNWGSVWMSAHRFGDPFTANCSVHSMAFSGLGWIVAQVGFCFVF